MARVIDEWHRIVRERDFEALERLLDDSVRFHSPVVHTPQEGKPLTLLYLRGAFEVLLGGQAGTGNSLPTPESSPFRYLREVVGDRDAMLEFVTEIEGIVVNGVDMIRWNENDLIVDFKVMIRPLKAIQQVHTKMAAMLERVGTSNLRG